MKILYANTIHEVKIRIKQLRDPDYSILFQNINDLPIAAWTPNGRDSGILTTRFDVRKGRNLNSGNGCYKEDAMRELIRNVRAST